jgi:hypothetical protein
MSESASHAIVRVVGRVSRRAMLSTVAAACGVRALFSDLGHVMSGWGGRHALPCLG